MTLVWLALAIGCAAVSALTLRLLLPLLARGAVAHPNARSGHRRPTPQGAGLAVIPVALIGAGVAVVALGAPSAILPHALAVAVASLLLMGLGFLDDRRPLPVLPRLLLQVAAAILVAASLPADFRLSPLPPLIERPLLVLTILWAVNLTNFMDGMDWLAGSEAIAICLGIVVLGATGVAPAWLAGVSAALLGAVAGFMPANAPVARVFLGDAGSLPLGLALCVLLLHLAERGAPAAAAILPLYFIADATFTLALRSFRGEPLWVAHRDHWYQRSLRGGASGWRVLRAVAVANGCLIALALASATGDAMNGLLALAGAAAAVAALLVYLGRSPAP